MAVGGRSFDTLRTNGAGSRGQVLRHAQDEREWLSGFRSFDTLGTNGGPVLRQGAATAHPRPRRTCSRTNDHFHAKVSLCGDDYCAGGDRISIWLPCIQHPKR